MSKGGIIVLIVAALVFCGLGFVIGQVVQASGSVAGSENDPVVTQSYVDKLVGKQVSALQAEIDEINAALKGNTTPSAPSESGNANNQSGNNSSSNNNSKASSVKVTSDAVNIRASASTEATVVGTAAEGDVLAYLGSTSASDGTWYNVKMANGTTGYIASWLCSEPY
ncbi:MAG: SH3 domain-containing protein [Firmicutes bacterium]|nr:SH3 domain-containing protein [Bacillota bacterium]MBQ3286994.1 SH3 domain-containing protein [Bacillota bacterium]